LNASRGRNSSRRFCLCGIGAGDFLLKKVKHLRTKRNGKGLDGMLLSELEEYWKLNGDDICQRIRDGKYQPGIVLIKEYINSHGKRRNISCMNSVDRFITRLLAQKMRKYIEPAFLPNSYAYQEGKGVLEAVLYVKKLVEAGYIYMAEIDLKNYFDTISIPLLLEKIQGCIKDEVILTLLEKYLYCSVSHDGIIQKKSRGILTGSAISPILSNIYLHEFDKYIEKLNYKWMRFADNIYIFLMNKEETFQIYNMVCKFLVNQLQLEININKSGVFSVKERIILGYDILINGGQVEVRKHIYRQHYCYHKWHDSRMEMINGKYHIVSDGIINREDYVLLFENESKKHFLPVEVINQINIYSHITLASNVLSYINEKKIRANFFDKYGRLIGQFVPEKTRGKSNIVLLQCGLYLDEKKRLDIARKMEIANLHNIRSNLRYYEKHENGVYHDAIQKISELIEKENYAMSINQIMLLEAQARQIYYQTFVKIVKDENFMFIRRTKRPPKDEINACISFGNSILYNEFLNIIWMKGLDPAIGIVHATNRRNYSLNLDFADIFKPIISDLVIFTLLNRKMLNINDFECNGNGVFLKEQGKKIFLEMFEKKLGDALVIKGKKYTYRDLMLNEVQKFKNMLINGEQYKPYKYY